MTRITKEQLPAKSTSVEQTLAAARAVRSQVKRELTEKEINQAKRQARA